MKVDKPLKILPRLFWHKIMLNWSFDAFVYQPYWQLVDPISRPRNELVKRAFYIPLRSRYQDYVINARKQQRFPRDVDAATAPALDSLKTRRCGAEGGGGRGNETDGGCCKGKTKLSSVNAPQRGTRLLVDWDQSRPALLWQMAPRAVNNRITDRVTLMLLVSCGPRRSRHGGVCLRRPPMKAHGDVISVERGVRRDRSNRRTRAGWALELADDRKGRERNAYQLAAIKSCDRWRADQLYSAVGSSWDVELPTDSRLNGRVSEGER
jgi:hypothetical protein